MTLFLLFVDGHWTTYRRNLCFTSFHGMTNITICQIRIQKPNDGFSFFVPLFFDWKPMTDVHILLTPTSFFPTKEQSSKRAPDLVRLGLYSLFGPLCFVSFLKFCLHPGSNVLFSRSLKIEQRAQTKNQNIWVLSMAGAHMPPVKRARHCKQNSKN